MQRKPLTVPIILHTYGVNIGYSATAEVEAKITDHVLTLKCPPAVKVSCDSSVAGNFVTLTSGRQDSVEKHARKVLRIIARFKATVTSGAVAMTTPRSNGMEHAESCNCPVCVKARGRFWSAK